MERGMAKQTQSRQSLRTRSLLLETHGPRFRLVEISRVGILAGPHSSRAGRDYPGHVGGVRVAIAMFAHVVGPPPEEAGWILHYCVDAVTCEIGSAYVVASLAAVGRGSCMVHGYSSAWHVQRQGCDVS